MLRPAMDDVRAELQAAEDEARQQAASLRQRARRLRLRGFGNLADELEAHAVALHETADSIVAQLEALPPPQRVGVAGVTRATRSLSPVPPHAVVVEHLAEPSGRAETQLGMALAEVSGHRRRLGVADAITTSRSAQ